MSAALSGGIQFARALVGIRPDLVEKRVQKQAILLASERAAMLTAERQLGWALRELDELCRHLQPWTARTTTSFPAARLGRRRTGRPAPGTLANERTTSGNQKAAESGFPHQHHLGGYSRSQVEDYFARARLSLEAAKQRRGCAETQLVTVGAKVRELRVLASSAEVAVSSASEAEVRAHAPPVQVLTATVAPGPLPLLAPSAGETAPLARIGRVAGWVRTHWLGIALVVFLLAAVGLLHGIGLNTSPAPQEDEGTYIAQAWALQTHHVLAPFQYWYDHPPLGWIQLTVWTAFTNGFGAGSEALDVGRHLVLIDYLMSAALLYLICRRLQFRHVSAAAAVVLFAASPLAAVYQRYVFLDNLAMPWMLASIVLALSPKRQIWAYAGSGICFAIAVLSKETYLLLLPALTWQVWQGLEGPRRAFCLTVFGAAAAFTAALYPLYALLNNELLPGRGHVSLWFGVTFQLFSRASSGSVLNPASPAHQLVSSWLRLDPWLLGVGIALVPVAFLVSRLRPMTFGLAIDALIIFRGGYLPTPFVIAVIPLAAIVVAGVADAAWGRNRLLGWWYRSGVAATPSYPTAAVVPVRSAWGTEGRWRGTAVTLARRGMVVAVCGTLVVLAGPRWVEGDQATMQSSSAWTNFVAAERWVETRIPHRDTILVSDTMWADLVDHGFPPAHAVWFFKLGYTQYDPRDVVHRWPTWRGIDVIVSDNNMRSSLFGSRSLPADQTRLALANSTVVTRFGTGHGQIDILRVHA